MGIFMFVTLVPFYFGNLFDSVFPMSLLAALKSGRIVIGAQFFGSLERKELPNLRVILMTLRILAASIVLTGFWILGLAIWSVGSEHSFLD